MSGDELATDVLPAPKAAAHVDVIGRSLGKFTIVELLGKGGSGDVYRAEQTQLGRSAVVKVLRAEARGPGGEEGVRGSRPHMGAAWSPNRVERFLREARLASKLDHPYAAHIYAFGAEADGVLWIAMEHVKGMTLDELVARRGALPPHVFAPLFARLCEVVHTAHELGIIHRDIKGSNVMVIERAGQLLPKLLDFGIAKGEDAAFSPAVGDTGTTVRELTGTGTTLGSPHYMSPEQWERPAEVDARADIYALGVLAYRCTCGYLPFRSMDKRMLARDHLHEPVPPLPELVSPGIADAIYRAMAKRPDARWPTAVAFSEAIRQAANAAVPETVPLFDPAARDAWLRAGPQPIADAIAHLASATTTVEADAALRELVAITCRWLAVLALAGVPGGPTAADPVLRDRARGVVGRDDAAPWLELARAARDSSAAPLPGLVAALAGADELAALAARLDDRDRPRTAQALASDIAAASEALRPLEPLLAYQLVRGLGRDNVAESWQGPRRRDRERVLVWGEPLEETQVALLDGNSNVVAMLSPLVQVIAPLPSAEPELFLLWRSGRGAARLVAAPWGFERDDEAAGARLAALTTESVETQHDVAEDHSPYPGLAAYGQRDAENFFGRERELEVLANRLVRSPLIAVLGPSGVGKSSFLHAGLVPRLGESHAVVTMRPGRHPMQALAGLGDLRALGEQAARGLVLVVDQLEELVTLCSDLDERRAFAEALAAAASGPDAPVRVVASLRDDFATVIEAEDALRGKFEVFVLASPAPEALRRIVVEPARRAAVTFDARVVEDMVAEVAGRPASLPLLSFTAAQLWQTRDRTLRRIKHDAYLALGGVAGALATYADEIYGSLGRRDQELVRALFARLVAADGTRVPWPRRELEQVPGAGGVLANLVDARLLVLREDPSAAGGIVVEIVHECLAERWPRLARWRSEDAADRAMLDDVRAAARRWQDGGHRADLLWRGQALAELRRLTGRSTALTELERAFAEASSAAQVRARRIRRGVVAGVMAGLAGVAGVMAYLGHAANDSRAHAQADEQKARDAAKLAEDRLTQSLIAQGKRELNDGRALQSLAYFAEAMRRGADSTGLRVMISAAKRGWNDTLLVEHDVTSNALTTSPNGWICAGDDKGHLRWWSDTGALVATLDPGMGPIASVNRLADDGVVITTRDGAAHIDAAHRVVAHIKLGAPTWFANVGPAADELTVVAEKRVEVYGTDGTLRRHAAISGDAADAPLFDATNRYLVLAARGEITSLDLVTMQPRTITKTSFSLPAGTADGTTFGYIDRVSHDVHVITAAGAPIRVLHPTVRGGGLSFSATGDRVAVYDDRQIEVLDEHGKSLETYFIEGDEGVVILRGDDMWTTGKNGVLRHYHAGDLAASMPLALTDLMTVQLGGNAVAALASDSTLFIARANAVQYTQDKPPCDHQSFGADGIGAVFTCGDTQHAYIGRRLVGDVPGSNFQVYVALDPKSDRGAVSGKAYTAVLDAKAKVLARGYYYGPIAFEDEDHLLLLEAHKQLWRWTISKNEWREAQPLPDGDALAAIGPGAYAVGLENGTLVLFRDDREVHRLNLGYRAAYIVASPNGHTLAVQLDRGDTVMVDAASGQIVRTLEAADAYGAATTFDPSGDLLVRETRGAVTIWDRASGEDLLFGLDLLKNLQNARMLPDGRLETDGESTGLLDIPRETRPAAEVIREIECHVPLRVVQSRLEPTTVAPCKRP